MLVLIFAWKLLTYAAWRITGLTATMSVSNSVLGLVNSAANIFQRTPEVLIHATQFRCMGSVRGYTEQAQPSNQPDTYEAQPNPSEAPLDPNDPAY